MSFLEEKKWFDVYQALDIQEKNWLIVLFVTFFNSEKGILEEKDLETDGDSEEKFRAFLKKVSDLDPYLLTSCYDMDKDCVIYTSEFIKNMIVSSELSKAREYRGINILSFPFSVEKPKRSDVYLPPASKTNESDCIILTSKAVDFLIEKYSVKNIEEEIKNYTKKALVDLDEMTNKKVLVGFEQFLKNKVFSKAKKTVELEQFHI